MDGDRFNLSAAALRYRELTLFFLLAIAIAGAMAFFRLGQREDPDFAFRAMVIRTLWPGATAEQVDHLVTDRIEKKLQETPYYKFTRSYSKPGESLIVLELLDTAPPAEVPGIWYQVRKKVGDIRPALPPEALGPFFNDEFGDVYGSIYAFTAEGFTLSELRDYVERVRQEVLRLPNVAKAELVGVQDDRIFVEISSKRLAALGIDPQSIGQALTVQNAIVSPGSVETRDNQVALRVTGQLDSVQAVSDLRLRSAAENGAQTFRLGDIARITRGYADPPVSVMRFGGREALGLSVSMLRNGDVLKLGEDLQRTMARMKQELPVGVEFEQVSDQPSVVRGAVGEFMRSLGEAVAIVMAISFLALGMRTGFVVALTIPLVLAATFLGMYAFGIDLHRISTGALIIALGLLVDDAMIAVEMMHRKLEEGMDKLHAATHAYATTAFPMLTGTLITAAGFLPIATAKSTTGEYTFGIFAVTSMALVISWFAAVIATPFIGSLLLKEHRIAPGEAPREMFDTPFYRRLRSTIDWCIEHRYKVLVATAASLVLGALGMKLTEKQFFPSSNRVELLVDLWLPEGASIRASEREAARVEKLLQDNKDVSSYVTYVGNGSPRFFLSLDQQLFRSNFSQTVVLTKDVEGRERVIAQLRKAIVEDFPGVRGRVNRVPLGPPVNYPVQFRVSGEDPAELKRIADRVADKVRANPATVDTNIDWGDRVLALRVDVDQEKARALGVSSQSVSRAAAAVISGIQIGQYRENDRLIEVLLRAPADERASLAALGELNVPTATGRSVPLSQVATIGEMLEEPILWRRSRDLTLTVRADIVDKAQAPDVTTAIEPELAGVRASLPPGYRVEAGGAWEENSKAQASIAAGMPMVLAIIAALLMLQLKSFSRSFMVLLTAPLGIVGVAIALLAFGKPFGFVAMLGTIALGGMIMRNTVILVDQIEQDRDAGAPAWTAIREAAVRRFRPIVLTAAAAVLAMIPLTRSVLWGPMAYAIMGGLIVATALTLLFVPALYAAWFKVRKPDSV
ncbi:MAG: efflux RND transporter permease subunit [Candidatus Parcubacteria bacterium]|nr:efflux RND transporter permease subunit [Burkholderiales bacterium]